MDRNLIGRRREGSFRQREQRDHRQAGAGLWLQPHHFHPSHCWHQPRQTPGVFLQLTETINFPTTLASTVPSGWNAQQDRDTPNLSTGDSGSDLRISK